jgi:hypothetical protein
LIFLTIFVLWLHNTPWEGVIKGGEKIKFFGTMHQGLLPTLLPLALIVLPKTVIRE